jgi:hypothetical protein
MPDGMMPNSVVFTSWKEIASYLGKGVRTVQRWEAQFGLPVQRPNARDKGIVRASREELDEWIATRWSPRLKKPDAIDSFSSPPPAKVQGAVETHHQLQAQNRELLFGLQQSLEELSRNCQSLAINLASCRELRTQTPKSFADPEIAPRPFMPVPPAYRQAKAE